MPYDANVLRRASRQLEESARSRRERTRRLREDAYRREPRLAQLDRRIQGTMAGLVAAALRQGGLADVGQHDGLAPVAEEELVPGFHGHARRVGPVALLLRQADGFRRAEALRLAHVQKALVPGAVVLHGRPVRFAQAVIAVFLRGEELFFQLLEF